MFTVYSEFCTIVGLIPRAMVFHFQLASRVLSCRGFSADFSTTYTMQSALASSNFSFTDTYNTLKSYEIHTLGKKLNQPCCVCPGCTVCVLIGPLVIPKIYTVMSKTANFFLWHRPCDILQFARSVLGTNKHLKN